MRCAFIWPDNCLYYSYEQPTGKAYHLNFLLNIFFAFTTSQTINATIAIPAITAIIRLNSIKWFMFILYLVFQFQRQAKYF